MGRDALKGYHCKGKRPWIGMKKEYNDPVLCSAQLRGLQRGASNVYFSQTVSALTIPPLQRGSSRKLEINGMGFLLFWIQIQRIKL